MILTPLQNGAIFLVSSFFSLYITVVLIRFLLQLVRADFYNQLSQFVVKVTNPALKPLRKIIPGVAGIDMASVVLLLALEFIKTMAILAIKGSLALNASIVLGILILNIADLVNLTINIYYFSIFILVILSWVAPMMHNPIINLINQLTEPLMRIIRKFIPPISGFDLSPIFAFIFLTLMDMVVVQYLKIFATGFLR